jgi:hypothetical protein
VWKNYDKITMEDLDLSFKTNVYVMHTVVCYASYFVLCHAVIMLYEAVTVSHSTKSLKHVIDTF